MSILSKIFSTGAKELVGTIGGVLDDLTTSKEEKLEKMAEISKIINDKILELYRLQSEIVQKEMSGNWLQRSWRPIIMLSFGFIIMYYYFISPVFSTPGIGLPDQFWNLLKIGLGGYVIGRSAEKIVKSNPDILNRNRRK